MTPFGAHHAPGLVESKHQLLTTAVPAGTYGAVRLPLIDGGISPPSAAVPVVRNSSALGPAAGSVFPTVIVWLAASTLSAWPPPNCGSVNVAPLTATVPPLVHPAAVRSSAEKEFPPSALLTFVL